MGAQVRRKTRRITQRRKASRPALRPRGQEKQRMELKAHIFGDRATPGTPKRSSPLGGFRKQGRSQLENAPLEYWELIRATGGRARERRPKQGSATNFNAIARIPLESVVHETTERPLLL